MERKAVLSAVLVLSIAASPFVSGGSAQLVPDAHVYVSEVQVSPNNPAPGDAVTVTATIRNSKGSNEPFKIYSVSFNGEKERNLGTISPGDSVEVSVTTEFEATGIKTKSFDVYGTDPQGSTVDLSHPVSVVVENIKPLIEMSFDDPVANTENTVNVTVSNGGNSQIRDLKLKLGLTETENQNTKYIPTKTASNIDPSQSKRFEFNIAPSDSGYHTVKSVVKYTTGIRNSHSYTKKREVYFREVRGDVELNAETLNGGNRHPPPVRVEIINSQNTGINDVTVSLLSDGNVIRSDILPNIPEYSSESTDLNVSDVDSTKNLTAKIEYVVERGAESRKERQVVRSEGTTLNYNPNIAEVTVTGVNIERESGKLHISGSASNTGLGDAESVLVEVMNTRYVSGAYPNKEYFVGTVPQSDFVSFDLYAQTQLNVSQVPVRVSYIADGESKTKTVELNITHKTVSNYSTSSSGSDNTPLSVIVIGMILGIIAISSIAYAWKNSVKGEEPD